LIETLAMNGRVDGLITNGAIAGGRHAFDISTRAEALAGTGQHNTADFRVAFRQVELCREGLGHLRRHGISGFWTIKGQGQDPLLEGRQQMICSCVQLCVRHA
jgi:hypothetical protein